LLDFFRICHGVVLPLELEELPEVVVEDVPVELEELPESGYVGVVGSGSGSSVGSASRAL